MREVIEAEHTEWTHRYRRIETWLHQRGQSRYANRMNDILKEAESGQSAVTVAFCGLFSAGKSSLINALSQANRLATGAVPTTAEIASVALPNTEGRVVLLDTPGVDSTDESHREATMNALHRADVMVLVADYQHVEAEENLELLRAFSEEGKRLLLVVNQVDKHLDFELPFETFQRHVEEALEDYGIAVEHTFYTSTATSPYNQLASLRSWLAALGNGEDSSQQLRLEKRLIEVAKDAVDELYAAKRETVLLSVEERMGQTPLHAEEATAWLNAEREHAARLNEAFRVAYEDGVSATNSLRERWVRTVELAQIAPYETTERGRMYVESLRPDFKVGVLRAAKKTEAEQVRRAEAFVSGLQERVTNYLLVPLRNQMVQDQRLTPWAADSLTADVEQIDVVVDVQMVRQQVKTGALVSTQYPYQYVKDVVARIKRDALSRLTAVMDKWFEYANEVFFANHEATKHAIEEAEQRIQVLESYLTVERDAQQMLQTLIEGEVPSV